MGLPLEKIHMETFAFHELKGLQMFRHVQYELYVVQKNLVQIKPINNFQQILQ